MKLTGSIYHFFPGYLDHITPLCSLLDIPVVVTEKKFVDLINKFYPKVNVFLHEDYLTYCPFLLKKYEIIFSCQMLYSDLTTQTLLQMRSNNYLIVWLPHGHSDKGHQSKIFEPLKEEKVTLIYGQKMLDTFKEQGVLDKIKNKIVIGNFRKHYYTKNKAFYKKIVEKEIKTKLTLGKKIILYAPTWEDYEKNGSYKEAIYYLLEQLPDDFILLVKPHHNTYLKHNAEIIRLRSKYEGKNCLFIEDFPSIYPLLDLSDIYLGDMSSIGYDFLSFNKPMFFFNTNNRDIQQDPGLYLFRTGVEIKPDSFADIYSIINKEIAFDQKFKSIRKKVYDYTFGRLVDFKELKKTIMSIHKNGT
jgi:teichoic acid glycerol-phosphate primase